MILDNRRNLAYKLDLENKENKPIRKVTTSVQKHVKVCQSNSNKNKVCQNKITSN
jgi:hypothetical protein